MTDSVAPSRKPKSCEKAYVVFHLKHVEYYAHTNGTKAVSKKFTVEMARPTEGVATTETECPHCGSEVGLTVEDLGKVGEELDEVARKSAKTRRFRLLGGPCLAAGVLVLACLFWAWSGKGPDAAVTSGESALLFGGGGLALGGVSLLWWSFMIYVRSSGGGATVEFIGDKKSEGRGIEHKYLWNTYHD